MSQHLDFISHWPPYLFRKAASRMTWQTSRKGTSFVRVYPWRTLGSARVVVEAEVQGVGMFKGSFATSGSGGVEAAERLSL